MSHFTISLIQLNNQDNVMDNVRTIEQYLYEAAAKKSDIVLLPENAFFLNGSKGISIPDCSEAISTCQAKARELGLWIGIGSVHVPAESGKHYNRSLLINKAGEIIAQYDKIHLFDVTLNNGEIYRESDRIQAGSSAVLADTPFGRFGLSVCYDVRFPGLYRTLAKAGADFLTVPAAFTYTTGTAHWHTLLRARAIETGCHVFAPAQCGTHPGNRRTYGHSLIISPWGDIIAEADEHNPGIITATIDVFKVKEARSMIPSLQHDREYEVRHY